MPVSPDIRINTLPICDDRTIWDVWMSVYHFPALTVADELKLFPLLAKAPASTREIANHLTISVRGTEALLGVLTSLGFMVQHQGRFHLTEVARTYLLPDSPYYYGGVLRAFRERIVSHKTLREALETDGPVDHEDHPEHAGGWRSGSLPLDKAATLTQLMHSHSFPAAFGVAQRGDFQGVRRMLDVGGGSGCFDIALAQRYPEIEFLIMELDPVCDIAQRYIADYGLQDRIKTAAVNMFSDPWPTGYDAIFVSNIFHDWELATCRDLARRCFEALPPGGRIYVHEMLLEDTKDGPLTTATFSMLMLSDTHGKQFTAGELDELLESTGFENVAFVPTYAYYSLVTATKPK